MVTDVDFVTEVKAAHGTLDTYDKASAALWYLLGALEVCGDLDDVKTAALAAIYYGQTGIIAVTPPVTSRRRPR